MNRFLALFDRFWRWWTLLCGVIAVAGVCVIASVVIKQAQQDKVFVRTDLLPLAQFVETFRDTKGRLPTAAEFTEWTARNHWDKTEYYAQKPPFVSGWGTPGRDFVVGHWRGEWMHYYRSWDGRDFAGEMAPLGEPTPQRR